MISDQEYGPVIKEVIGSLLAGDARLFGRPVALAWPEGPTPYWPPDALQALGRKWVQDSRHAQNRWVEATEAAAEAARYQAAMETLALSTWFAVERGPDGEPVKLVPLPGRLDFDPYSGGYVVRQEVRQ